MAGHNNASHRFALSRSQRRPRLESLEDRICLSFDPGLFQGTAFSQWAEFEFQFSGAPEIVQDAGGTIVTLDGEESWATPGDPVVPVRDATLLLPQGMEITDVEVTFLGGGTLVASNVQLTALPAAMPMSQSANASVSIATAEVSFPGSEAVEFTNYSLSGYSLGQLRIFPVAYDALADTLTFFDAISVKVTLSASDESGEVGIRPSSEDREQVADLIDNPEALDLYYPAEDSVRATTSYDYLVVTNAALAGSFQPLVARKIEEGLTAAIFTTEYIVSHYTGTETGDLADRVRQFLKDAYTNWNTQWVLLGGDTEIIPMRGVYASVGSYVDNALPTDMYYACLDGTWNGDGDTLWGEANDGTGGGDIDLVAELYIGRAPVSNATEAGNFVTKTIAYATTTVTSEQTALWLGEQLDSSTQGSYSGIPILEAAMPDYWNVTEMYDSVATWTGSQVVAELNSSPVLVNHLGHANEIYNARMINSDVAGLANVSPYFMYSQGCYSGALDRYDICIAEQHVVGANGAIGVVMNSRYGWYSPGSVPGGSHFHAMQFWDAVFNEGMARLGQANHDSKIDNLYLVSTTGVFRWIHFETNLFGDPHTALQLGSEPEDTSGSVEGTVASDGGAAGQPGQTVYIDSNGNGLYDEATLIEASSSQAYSILDHSTVRATITVSGAAAILSDVNVALNITHTYDSDLEVYLISPTGTRILLFSGVGGWRDNFTGTVLDDEASVMIQNGTAPFTGSFQPTVALSGLDGENPNGIWTLEVHDRYGQDQGTLNGWSLAIVSAEQTATTDADGHYSFSGLEPGTYRVGWADTGDTWRLASPEGGFYSVVVPESTVVTGVDFLLEPDPGVPDATDLGAAASYSAAGLDLSTGEKWFRIEALHTGLLSAELLFASGTGLITLFDVNVYAMESSAAVASGQRLDADVVAGRVYYLRLAGDAASAELRLVNLVAQNGSDVTIYGTDGDDELMFQGSTTCWLSIAGIEYTFGPAGTLSFAFDGGAGYDTVVLIGSNGSDVGVLRTAAAYLAGTGYQFSAARVEARTVDGAGGADLVRFYDSAGNDNVWGNPDEMILSCGADYARAVGCESVHVFATAGGYDYAELTGSAENDALIASPSYVKLYNDSYFIRVVGFDEVDVSAGAGGTDTAIFHDSTASDVFTATPESAEMDTGNCVYRATGFDTLYVLSRSGGYDAADFHDSAGNDGLYATPRWARFTGDGFFYRVQNFRTVRAYATAGGDDIARLYDSAGADTLVANQRDATLTNRSYFMEVYGFGGIHVYASTGSDRATLYGSAGDDTFYCKSGESRLYGADYYIRAKLFDTVWAHAGAGGNDTATIIGTTDVDTVRTQANWAELVSGLGAMTVYDFAAVRAVAYGYGDQLQTGTIDYLLETAGTWV